MALIKSVRGHTPVFGSNCFLADNCTVIGDVITGDDCSIWFNTVIRGDVNSIRIGNKVNIQDNSVLHCTYKKTTVTIGNNVTIGHNGIVHGALIEDNVLVGMGAILMDRVSIGTNSIIAAGAVLPEGTIVEPGSIYAGVPARRIGDADQAQLRELVGGIAERYTYYSGWYRE